MKLSPRSMDVLCYLAARPGVTVTHGELLAAFWRGAVSSTNALHKASAELRHAFASGGDATIHVETVPKRGYRLVVPVEPIATDSDRQAGGSSTPETPLDAVGSFVGLPGIKSEPRRPFRRSRRWLAGVLAGAVFASASIVWLATEGRSEATAIGLHNRTAVLLPMRDGSATAAEQHLHQVILGRIVARFDAEPTAVVTQMTRLLLPSAGRGSSLGWSADYAVELRVKIDRDQLVAFVDSLPADRGHLPQHVQLMRPIDAKAAFVEDVVARVADDLDVLLDEAAVAQMREWGTASVLAYRLAREGDGYQRMSGQAAQENAAARFRAAIQEDPDFDYGLISLAAVYYTIGRFSGDKSKAQDARHELQSLVRQASTRRIDPRWRDRIAGWFEELSVANAFDAEALWRQALHLEPSNYDALVRYSELLRGAGLFRWYIAYVDRAIAIARSQSDEDSVEFLSWQRATVSALAEGDLEEWLTVHKRAVDGPYTDDILTLYGIVETLAYVGRLPEAEHYAARLKRADPTWGRAAELNLRAWRGDLTVGGTELAAILADDTISHSQRGAICFQLGDVACGVEQWRRIEPPFLRLEWSNLATMERFWRPGVTEDPRYQALLDELGIGRKWRAYLEARAGELATATRIPIASDIAAGDDAATGFALQQD